MHAHKDVKRWLGAAAVASSLALILSACSASGSGSDSLPATPTEPSAPVTITYSGAAYAAADIQPVLDAFHKEHPNITVNYQSVPFADFNSTLATRLGNKDRTLDVFDTDMPRTDAYAARGWLADITPAFGSQLNGKVDPSSISAATVDGKLLTMPYQTSTNVMYYNKKLLAAAHIRRDPAGSERGTP